METRKASTNGNERQAATGDAGKMRHERSSEDTSLLTVDVHIEGKMRTKKDVRILGTFDGELECHELFIGVDATVKGDIKAEVIKVMGHLSGKAEAKAFIAGKTAIIEGEVSAVQFGAELGARVMARLDAPGVPATAAVPAKDAEPRETVSEASEASPASREAPVTEADAPAEASSGLKAGMPFLIKAA